MSELQPVEITEQETGEHEFDPETLSDEELAKYIDDPDSYQPPEEEETEEPEAEEEPVADDSGDEELPAVDEVEEPEEEETAEPEVAEVTEEDLEAQERELALKEYESRAKHFETLAGKHAGKIGFLEQQIKALQGQSAAADTDSYMDSPVSGPVAPDLSEIKKVQETLLSHQVAQAVQGAAMQFKAEHADDLGDKEFLGDFGEALKATDADFDKMYAGNDPAVSAAEVKMACETAFIAAKRKQITRQREQLASRSADSSEKLKKRKRAMSAAKPPSTPAPPSKQKTPEEMTDEELKAYIDSM